MATSSDGIGWLIGATAFVYGASKRAQADDAARAFDALRAKTDNRIAEQQQTIRARERQLEGVQSQLRTITDEYAQTKCQLDATTAARAKDQTEHASVMRTLDAEIVDLTRKLETEHVAMEQTQAQNVALEAQVRAGMEREQTKDQRIADLEARIRELEARGASPSSAP